MSIKVQFNGKEYDCDTTRPLLFTMNEQGAMIPHSCQQGICQSCLCIATEGSVSETSKIGLTDSQKEQGFFLPCVCKPAEDLDIKLVRKTAGND